MTEPLPALSVCPFCGNTPMFDDSTAWCLGTHDEPHGMVMLDHKDWNTRRPAGSGVREAIELLKELHAMVWGECPSLLNEDSGGSAHLDLRIRAALAEMEGK